MSFGASDTSHVRASAVNPKSSSARTTPRGISVLEAYSSACIACRIVSRASLGSAYDDPDSSAAPTSLRSISGTGSAATISGEVILTRRSMPSMSWSVRNTRCLVP